MRPRNTGGRIAALLVMLTLTAWATSAATAYGGDEIVSVDERFSYAGGPDDLVLEVRVSGGFGKMLGHVFRLYGDGRLEEALIWSTDRAGTVPVRELPFPAETRDRFLRELVESGVPGATYNSLVAELQARDPRYKDLVSSPDCLQVYLRLSLLERTESTQKPSELVTELSLSCTHKYPEIYSESRRLVTLAASIEELLALSEAAGWE